MTTSRTLSVAFLALGALALAGCATGGQTAGDSATGATGAEIEVDAGWLDGGRLIAVVTQGSSTCVPVASDVQLQADGTLAVTLVDADADAVCTRDLVPRASLVAVPDGVDVSQKLDIVVAYGEGGRGETDLDGYTGAQVEEYTPSAGWVDDDLFAVLTWGSSSCPPTVEGVTASDPATVDVTFVTPPADQVCTMDMASRVVLVSTGGLDVDDEGAGVTLSGGGAQFATPVTVPIAG